MRILVAFFFLWAAALCPAQVTTGEISGTVVDGQGAPIPGAKVRVVEEATGQRRDAVTNDSGYFLVPSLPVGIYSVEVEFPGFKKSARRNLHVEAGARLAADFPLQLGPMETLVEVVAVGERVETRSGEVTRLLDGEQIRELALNGRNYLQLLQLLPGVASLDDDQMALTTSLSVTAQAVNGLRGNTNNLTVDGTGNLDSGSNGSQVNNVGVDFIQEVRVATSNFSAEYGRNSGAAINVTTRGGGKNFHGTLFEFFRNDVLDARSAFSPKREPLRYNDFGWNLGGPIYWPGKPNSRRDRVFFFAGQEYKRLLLTREITRQTLPSSRELSGDFSHRLTGNFVNFFDTGQLFIPGTRITSGGQVIDGLPFPGNIIPREYLTPNGVALAGIYRRMAQIAAGTGRFIDRPGAATNADFLLRNPFNFRQDIVRLDYNFSQRHKLYGRYLHDNYDLIDPVGVFSGTSIPTVPTKRNRPGYTIQVTLTSLPNNHSVNELSVGTAWHKQRIPPVGDTWKRETYGLTFPELFTPNRITGIPDVSVTGFAALRGPSFTLIAPTTDINFRDNFTLVRGNHGLKAGFYIARNRKDQNGRTGINGSFGFTNAIPDTSGFALADMLLGNYRTYGEADTDPIGFFRYNQFEWYGLDSWRMTRRLTVELGVRFQVIPPIYTQGNTISNFIPAFFDPANARQVDPRTGALTRGGDPYNGIVIAGKNFPEDQRGRVLASADPSLQRLFRGAPRGLYKTPFNVAPRLGFACDPFGRGRTSIRGGFGVYFDRPEGNVIYDSGNNPPFSRTVSLQNGSVDNPASGSPGTEFPIALNAIDPNLESPYTMSYSLGIQQELPGRTILEVSYVSTLGRHLFRRIDLNRVPLETRLRNLDERNRNIVNVDSLRPYQGYAAIRWRETSASSSYHSIQARATRRYGRGLFYGVSYTFGKVLTDASGNTEDVEDNSNYRLQRSRASFDRPHILSANFSWELPWLRLRQGPVGWLLKGWQVSGIGRFQSGGFLTPRANTPTGSQRADVVGDWRLPQSKRTTDMYFNVDAFAPAPTDRLGTAAPNIIQGPGTNNWDLALMKNFRVGEGGKRIQFRAEAFNAFNHPSYRNLDTNLDNRNRGYGRVTSVGRGRIVQLALKLYF